jgi:signal transduction histidine kinase
VIVVATAVAGTTLAVADPARSEALSYAFLALATGTVTSVCGVAFLDRYRYREFVRTALLTQTSAALERSKQQAEEEADIAAALLHVGDTLSAHLGDPDVLERVTRVAVRAVGTDFGATFVWDDAREAFRLRAGFGIRPEVQAEVAALDLTRDSMPIVSAHRPGVLLQIPDADDQVLVPPVLLRRWEIASEMCAPIPYRGRVVGVMCFGFRARKGPFSQRERRLALGIAHATAMALENSRLIADLRAANQLKSEFVSTMSHELRTPLNVILGFTEMLRDAAVDPREHAHAIRRVDAAGRELLDMVESTLEAGKLEAGRNDVELAPVALPALWTGVRARCDGLPVRAGVTLEWPPAVPDLRLLTDPRKVAIVVRNLVANALKFTERGAVRVGVEAVGGGLRITVADTGVGIRPEDHAAVFEMFRQADGSDRRRFGGTGLGLYIVRRFVEQLGGAVTLASTPGAGSTFTVVLPAASVPVSRAA